MTPAFSHLVRSVNRLSPIWCNHFVHYQMIRRIGLVFVVIPQHTGPARIQRAIPWYMVLQVFL